ncbi:MAG: NAD(P)-dependent alcohol dehydrogenase [Steroidobacteraceae bacterium]
MKLPAKQQRYELRKRGANLEATLVEAPVEQPRNDEVLVRVRAASINRRDLMIAAGIYPTSRPEGVVPFSDGAGEVVATGPRVRQLKAGDHVAACFFRDWQDGRMPAASMATALGAGVDGMLAEFVTLPEHALVGLPKYLSLEEAATLPCAAVTAWSALFARLAMREGDWVLLQGTGGVAIFGLQLAKAAGARCAIISSSDEKLARAQSLGADLTINYRSTADWDKALLERTQGHGADCIFELGGKATIGRSMNALASGGQIAIIGGLSEFGGEVPTLALIGKSATVTGITVGSRADFLRLLEFMTRHSIRPIIDRRIPFAQAAQSYGAMAEDRHFGKIVVTV